MESTTINMILILRIKQFYFPLVLVFFPHSYVPCRYFSWCLGVSLGTTFARLHPDTRRHCYTQFGRILTNNITLKPNENRFLHSTLTTPAATAVNEEVECYIANRYLLLRQDRVCSREVLHSMTWS